MTYTTPALTIAEAKRRNKESGGHWFDPTSMRFFSSRVMSKVFPTTVGTFFVSSELRDGGTRRTYSVRLCSLSGAVSTPWQATLSYSLADAYRKASYLAAGATTAATHSQAMASR